MSARKWTWTVVLGRVGMLILQGCATLTPDERATACRAQNTPEIQWDLRSPCQYGKAWWFDHDEIIKLQEQETAEKSMAQEVAADQAKTKQIEAEEQKKSDEENQKSFEAARKEIEANPRYRNRRRVKFSSYQDAMEVLSPDAIPDSYSIARNPTAAFMGTKGHVIFMRAQIMQVVGRDGLLVNPCYVLRGAEDMGVPSMCPVFISLTPGCASGRDMADGMNLAVIAEIKGTMQYDTAMGTTKTVPKLVAYGITKN